MPNTFAPRAFADVIKDRTERLRVQHDGPKAEIKEWHAMVDLLNEDATASFLGHYNRAEQIPDVIDLRDGSESPDEDM
jgi:hypothetical protein